MNKESLQVDRSVKEIQRITWVGVAVNALLGILKLVLGLLGNSYALMADGIHSFSDLSTDFFVLLGVKMWSKEADEDHPYGHRRIEAIVTFLIGVFLLCVAVAIGYKALLVIRDHSAQQPQWIAFIGALLSIIFKEMLFQWTRKVGKRVKSSAVIANAWHQRSDALSSIPVALAVAAATISPQWSFLDQVGAFIVSLIILWTAGKIIISVLSEMIDTGASLKERKKIQSLILETKGVQSFHKLRTRRVGSGWYVDLHIQVDPFMTVQKGHEISEAVKSNLIENGPNILDVIIHLEPHQ